MTSETKCDPAVENAIAGDAVPTVNAAPWITPSTYNVHCNDSEAVGVNAIDVDVMKSYPYDIVEPLKLGENVPLVPDAVSPVSAGAGTVANEGSPFIVSVHLNVAAFVTSKSPPICRSLIMHVADQLAPTIDGKVIVHKAISLAIKFAFSVICPASAVSKRPSTPNVPASASPAMICLNPFGLDRVVTSMAVRFICGVDNLVNPPMLVAPMVSVAPMPELILDKFIALS